MGVKRKNKNNSKPTSKSGATCQAGTKPEGKFLLRDTNMF